MDERRSVRILYQNGARAREEKHGRRLGGRRRFAHMRARAEFFRASKSWEGLGSCWSGVFFLSKHVNFSFEVLAPFASLKKQAETLFRLICSERKNTVPTEKTS